MERKGLLEKPHLPLTQVTGPLSDFASLAVCRTRGAGRDQRRPGLSHWSAMSTVLIGDDAPLPDTIFFPFIFLVADLPTIYYEYEAFTSTF